MEDYILAIDQGTTSSRAIIFDRFGVQHAVHQIPFQQQFPHDGWVEHDPHDIWQTTYQCCQQVLSQVSGQVAALGISNQRETTVLWERQSGRPVYNAIVWQDRRTAAYCQELARDTRIAKLISEKTGLLIDPYFCVTKLRWLFDNNPSLKQQAERGELAFGTIDTYLLWQLTDGDVHATDVTNASRTLLFNIHTQTWDKELLALFDIPSSILPEVRDSNARFGVTARHVFGVEIPVTGIAGDQQAALIGQVCFNSGMAKCTYGTGCFVVVNTGDQPVSSCNRLLTTIAYRINGVTHYALEGSSFVAGAAIKWLRDALHLFEKASDSEALAKSVTDMQGVYLVPAFTGLGAPYWDPNARGALLGLTRDTSIAQIVRAALEAVCYQTYDLLKAMQADFHQAIDCLRVDGGMVANNWLIQFLSDILNVRVQRPTVIETSALGAAYLAGLGIGLYASMDDICSNWQLDTTCKPHMEASTRQHLLAGWDDSIKRVMSNKGGNHGEIKKTNPQGEPK